MYILSPNLRRMDATAGADNTAGGSPLSVHGGGSTHRLAQILRGWQNGNKSPMKEGDVVRPKFDSLTEAMAVLRYDQASPPDIRQAMVPAATMQAGNVLTGRCW